ncbi:TPA: hypothetical protein N0F65_003040 [Lagenidium giganteum]|uniref:FAD dependent oxidoreductase domain-containing protein n=2 Tax=Lagenidium giganteum TaxID=4803 RepID=A0AAV2YFM6_9STRA|nr:TPA: hypothetical protein N0F65_003040 [Lagenidium giganteum]
MVSEDSSAYDVIVIGAGLMGSAAARELAVHHQRVLLLEQFEFLHSKGSSHGPSRIFRLAYPDTTYTAMCKRSLEQWREIEAESGEQLLRFTGELDFALDRCPELDDVRKTLLQHEIEFEELDAAQVHARFPGLTVPSTGKGIYNKFAGVLHPTLACKVLQALAAKHGAALKDKSEVVDIKVNDDGSVCVQLADGQQVQARKVIVTAGPWSQALMEKCAPVTKPNNVRTAVQPSATFGMYWRCKDPANEALYDASRFPVFINYSSPQVYGLPMHDPAYGAKICMHNGPAIENPNKRQELRHPPKEDVEALKSFMDTCFPLVDGTKPHHVDLCMYSMTPDSDFILDFLPVPSANGNIDHKSVIMGVGFSGHGAKMTPVIGEILADLAVKGTTAHPLEKFRLNRQ